MKNIKVFLIYILIVLTLLLIWYVLGIELFKINSNYIFVCHRMDVELCWNELMKSWLLSIITSLFITWVLWYFAFTLLKSYIDKSETTK